MNLAPHHATTVLLPDCQSISLLPPSNEFPCAEMNCQPSESASVFPPYFDVLGRGNFLQVELAGAFALTPDPYMNWHCNVRDRRSRPRDKVPQCCVQGRPCLVCEEHQFVHPPLSINRIETGYADRNAQHNAT